MPHLLTHPQCSRLCSQTLSDTRHPGSGTEYLGLLGPVLRAEVGDTIVVTFKNNGEFAHNIEPFGLEEDKMAEPVQPGERAACQHGCLCSAC